MYFWFIDAFLHPQLSSDKDDKLHNILQRQRYLVFYKYQNILAATDLPKRRELVTHIYSLSVKRLPLTLVIKPNLSTYPLPEWMKTHHCPYSKSVT